MKKSKTEEKYYSGIAISILLIMLGITPIIFSLLQAKTTSYNPFGTIGFFIFVVIGIIIFIKTRKVFLKEKYLLEEIDWLEI